MNPLKIYNNLLASRPLTTNFLTSGFLFGLGDVIAQTVFEDNKEYDYNRTGNLFVLGSVFSAPIFYKWYRFLPQFCQKNIYYKYPNMSQFTKTLIQMSIDQTIFAFSFSCYFFIVINYMEHQSIQKGIDSIKEKVGESMIFNWKLWPAAQMINFSIIPLPYRLQFANLVGLIQNVYLSWIQHRESKLQLKQD